MKSDSDEAREEQRQISKRYQYEAICHNKWQSFIKHQAEQGIAYARMGMNFYMCYDLLVQVRNYMTPMLLRNGKMMYLFGNC